jgi:tetratricopeptide (TPR) repeat protein
MKASECLGRADLSGLLGLLSEDSTIREKRRWRIAEVLDLLIEAGQFRRALTLSIEASQRVEPNEAKRLFHAYQSFCELIVKGTVHESFSELYRYYELINRCDHSSADKTRMGLLLSRALLYGTVTNVLNEESVFRGRKILLDGISRTNNQRERALLSIELCKSYLLCAPIDTMAARGVLATLDGSGGVCELPDDVFFEMARLEYFVESKSIALEESVILAFRARFADAGVIDKRLFDLAVERLESGGKRDGNTLRRCGSELKVEGFLSGAFEAFFSLARDLYLSRKNVPALLAAKDALSIARESGYLYGEVSVQLLIHEIHRIGRDEKQMVSVRDALLHYNSQHTVVAQGAEIARLLLEFGEPKVALTYLRSSARVKAPEELGVNGDSALLSIEATALGMDNAWTDAARLWGRVSDIEQRRGLYLSSYGSKLQAYECMYREQVERESAERLNIYDLECSLNQLCALVQTFMPLEEAKILLGEAELLRAQFLGHGEKRIEALKCLSTARNLFESTGHYQGLAIVEVLTGWHLYHLGKDGDVGILESGVLSLKRAEEFFSTIGDVHMRWRLLYYIASAARQLTTLTNVGVGRVRWQKLALRSVIRSQQCYRMCARFRGGPRRILPVGFAQDLAGSNVRALRRELSGFSGGSLRKATKRFDSVGAGSNLLH